MYQLEEKIKAKLVETLDLSESDLSNFDYETPLFTKSDEDEDKGLGLDSLDVLELVVMIEDEWGIEVEEKEMSLLTTVKNIAAYVRNHGKE